MLTEGKNLFMKELGQSTAAYLEEQTRAVDQAQREGKLDGHVLVVQTVGKFKEEGEEGAEWFVLEGLNEGVKLFGPHCDEAVIGRLKQGDPLVVVMNRDLKQENPGRKDVPVAAVITQREGSVLYAAPNYDVENHSPGNMPLTTTYPRYG